jgi:hypothetical protein
MSVTSLFKISLLVLAGVLSWQAVLAYYEWVYQLELGQILAGMLVLQTLQICRTIWTLMIRPDVHVSEE